MIRSLATGTCLFATMLISSSQTASAQGIQEIAWLAGEIRGQMAVVNAQAEATLCDCDEYEDVQDELAELCEKMDRFEQLLAEPIRSNQQMRRLRKAAVRVNDQAEEVIEEINDAIEDLRDDRPRNHRARQLGYVPRHQVHQSEYGLRTQHYMLPPRFVSANQFGFTTPNQRVTSFGQFASFGPTYRSSSIQITLGAGRPRVQFVSTPTQVIPHHVGHPIIGHHDGGLNHNWNPRSDFDARQGGNSPTAALCAEADRLYALTCQLVRKF